jgi:hypothetical protein
MQDITQLTECPQCYCGKIRQMPTFLINLPCLKAYHKHDNSIFIIEHLRKKYYYYLLFIIIFSQVFPGTFLLEPMVNPITQASSF